MTTYWAWTFTGPYAWVALLQLWIAGGFINVITWLVVFTAVAIPLHFAARAVALRARLPFDEVPLMADATAAHTQVFVARHFFTLLGWLFVAGGLLAGGYFLIDGYLAGPLTELPVEKLYAGEPPVSRYVDLVGRALRDDDTRVGLGMSGRSGAALDFFYFPMVPDDWRPGSDVRVVVRSFYDRPTSVNGSASHPNRLRGILRGRVPGLPRTFLSRKVKVADNAWLLDETSSPDDDRALGLTLALGFGSFGLGLVGAARLFVWFVNRRT